MKRDHDRPPGTHIRVLVCGGRDWTDEKAVHDFLTKLHEERRIALVIEGGARGADHLARTWARKQGIPNKSFPAHWRVYGRAAGVIRNNTMLHSGKPDLVVAFPGGRGTADMVRRAKAAGVEVIEVTGARE